MSVTLNAKGTSTSSFKVGKDGTIITQGGVISPPAATDLIIDIDQDQSLVIGVSNTGPALITATADQDLHINPAVGGGQFLLLNATRWPTTAGGNGQTLISNGSGILSWAAPPSYDVPSIVIVSGTTQLAAAGFQYVLTNTGASTVVTLPPAPLDGDIIWITNVTSRTDSVIARNGEILQGVAEDMTINVANVNIQLRFINSTIGWRIL